MDAELLLKFLVALALVLAVYLILSIVITMFFPVTLITIGAIVILTFFLSGIAATTVLQPFFFG